MLQRSYFETVTRRINEQVKRNIERFPEDFMFKLTKDETELLRSQFATLDDNSGNLKSQIATSNVDFLRSQFATMKISSAAQDVK